jgi:hypothetical protein
MAEAPNNKGRYETRGRFRRGLDHLLNFLRAFGPDLAADLPYYSWPLAASRPYTKAVAAEVTSSRALMTAGVYKVSEALR